MTDATEARETHEYIDHGFGGHLVGMSCSICKRTLHLAPIIERVMNLSPWIEEGDSIWCFFCGITAARCYLSSPQSATHQQDCLYRLWREHAE